MQNNKAMDYLRSSLRLISVMIFVGLFLSVVSKRKDYNISYYISFIGSCQDVSEAIFEYITDNRILYDMRPFSYGKYAVENMRLCKGVDSNDRYAKLLCLLTVDIRSYAIEDYFSVQIVCYNLFDVLSQASICFRADDLYKCLSERPLDEVYHMLMEFQIGDEYAISDIRERYFNRYVPFHPSTLEDIKDSLNNIKMRLRIIDGTE